MVLDFSSDESRKWNWWDKLKWDFNMWRLKRLSVKAERKFKQLRKKYCRKGIHKLKQGSCSLSDGKKTIKVDYLKCQYCNWKFFANKKERDLYNKIHKSSAKGISSALLNHSLRDTKSERIFVSSEMGSNGSSGQKDFKR